MLHAPSQRFHPQRRMSGERIRKPFPQIGRAHDLKLLLSNDDIRTPSLFVIDCDATCAESKIPPSKTHEWRENPKAISTKSAIPQAESVAHPKAARSGSSMLSVGL